MRPIKFRAWVKKEKKIFPVNDLTFNGSDDEPVGVNSCGDSTCITCIDWYRFEEVELMQYTGLKDKNGVEICEGDIIKWQDERDVYSIEFGEFGVPNFEEEGYQDLAVGYYLKPQHDLKEVEPFNMTISLHEKYASRMEVIGNIYENPELLEVSK